MLVLAIVLPLVLNKSSDPDKPEPGPEPTPPLGNGTIYNPYLTTASSNMQNTIEGSLYAAEPY